MIKKTITYETFDGETVNEDFFFNLTKSEIVQWRFDVKGGLEKHLENIFNSRDEKSMMELLKDLIARSYGEKSVDGKRFEKVRDGHSLFEDFKQTNAYDVLFMELCDVEKATEFLRGVIPNELASALNDVDIKNVKPGGPAALPNA